MAYSLLIDTSKPTAWIAIVQDGNIIGEDSWLADKTLGVELLGRLQVLLDAHKLSREDIRRIGVHIGPGHFSALHSGIVTATLLATTLKAELIELTATDPAALVGQLLQGVPVKSITPKYT